MLSFYYLFELANILLKIDAGLGRFTRENHCSNKYLQFNYFLGRMEIEKIKKGWLVFADQIIIVYTLYK